MSAVPLEDDATRQWYVMTSQSYPTKLPPYPASPAGMAARPTRNWLRGWLLLPTCLMASHFAQAQASTTPAAPMVFTEANDRLGSRNCPKDSLHPAISEREDPSAFARIRQFQHNGSPPDAPICQQSSPSETARTAGATRQKALRITSIPVSQTAFDNHWSRVRAAPPSALMRSELNQAGVHGGMAKRDVLRSVNEYVNRVVTYISDDQSYGRRDFWAKPSETISKRTGDCEDFAILKLHLLQAAGYPADKIRLVLARDLAANRDHAFLVVFTPAGSKVLDNATDRVYSVKEAVALRPIMSFSEGNRWVHAIREDG